MKLHDDWLRSRAVLKLKSFFQSFGQDAYFVGGCVRNSLMQLPATDLDLASPVLPDELMKLAQTAGIKAIPTGLEHGTITLLIDVTPFEITTFRNDIITDGRHATVTFSKDMATDAARRDFTMNALYANLEGNVFDPLGGLDDLKARRVRFIGDPNARIREDYLRILRFFRFHATYGNQADGLDSAALAACAENLEGLRGLSAERVGAEMLKLLTTKDPSTAIGAMEGSGVLMQLLEGASGRSLFPYVAMEFSIDPIARLAALGGFFSGEALRLSKRQAQRLSVFRAGMASGENLNAIAQSEGRDIALGVAALRAALFEQPLAGNESAVVSRAAEAVFPVAAADLMPTFTGAALGLELKHLKRLWIESDFTLKKPELIAATGKPHHDTD
jgi:poly(A) polymerase